MERKTKKQTQELRARIIDLLEKGLSFQEIGNELNETRHNIQYHVKKMEGVEIEGQPRYKRIKKP